MPALSSTVSTVGRLGAELMVKQVGDMTRGSSGASEVEKGYLEAPYTQVRGLFFFGLEGLVLILCWGVFMYEVFCSPALLA